MFLVESAGAEPHVAKFIPKDPGADRELLFPDLADLRNVIPVLDRGEWNDYWVILMPRAERTLAAFLSSPTTPLSVDDAKGILVDIAEALASMDGRIIHRDVKPANILELNACWRLADFGISKYADATTVTETRKFVWTPAYAAPEQWRGETASSATDIYSFGVVAYELLAGTLPFRGPDRNDFRQQHLHDSPKPIADIPPRVASMVEECLYKEPRARPSATNVLARLQQLAQPESEAAQRLQEANLGVVRQRMERARTASRDRSDRERREQLRVAAKASLKRMIELLERRICSLASASEVSGDEVSGWRFTLGSATLDVEPIKSENAMLPEHGRLEGTVVASTAITLSIPRDRDGHEGQSHSLWYVQRSDSGCRWYELAFRIGALFAERARVNPFSLPPASENAQWALRGGLHRIELAKSPVTIDQGEDGSFIERWIGRFAAAVEADPR